MMTTKVLQFKITLRYVKPIVWRRIQVPENYTFWDLHVALQNAMGWWDSHLHEFEVCNPKTKEVEHFGIPDEEDDSYIVLPDWETKIHEYFDVKINKSVIYRYDFGDNWEHELKFEGAVDKAEGKYPRCLEGENAFPPEDVGGEPGYKDFLRCIKNPKDPEHHSMLEWVGGKFDPKAFDAHKIKFDNPKTRWKKIFEESIAF